MRRSSVVRILSGALEEGDIGMFIGDGICKEAFAYHRQGNFYLPNDSEGLSIGLGIAMNTLKRIFIFCDDLYLLKSLNDVVHIAVSKCLNIHIIILASGTYSESSKHPTIFKSIYSPVGMLFNIGFIVHDYKRHFKNSRNPTKEIRSIWQKTRGPHAVIMEVENSNKILPNTYPEVKQSLLDISCFIQNKDISAYNYNSPNILKDFVKKE